MPLTSQAIKSRAQVVGFDLCGISRVSLVPKLDRLREWLADGYAGEMTYLGDSLAERADPAQVLSSVRSIVSVAVLYNTDQPHSTDVLDAGRVSIARYAWGDDYHGVVRARLRELLTWMAETAGPGFEAFTCVDDGPVQERVWAEQGGLGWIGKNTCVINPELGSWLFLGEILCNVELTPDEPGVDHCGACTRCIDACPTDAIVEPRASDEPYAIDATRCLSYLTIETRGSVDESLRDSFDTHIFGCDVCQDVCPWNRRTPVSTDAAWQPRDGLAFPKLIELCRLSDADWIARLKDSALKRAGLHRLRRTLAYALGQSADPASDAALDAMGREPSGTVAVVREAIAWAREHRQSRAAGPR